MLLAGDALGLLHEQHAEALVLEARGVPGADGHHATVHVQLADDGAAASCQLGPECGLGAAPQPQQAHQDILGGVLVGEERLPPAVGHIVSPHQLHLQPIAFPITTSTILREASTEGWTF